MTLWYKSPRKKENVMDVGYSRVLKGAQGCFRVLKSNLGQSRAHKSAQGCSKAQKAQKVVQEHSRANQGLLTVEVVNVTTESDGGPCPHFNPLTVGPHLGLVALDRVQGLI